MGTKRILLVTAVVLMVASPASAQHEWVGEVFLGWGDNNLMVSSMTEYKSELFAGTYRAGGANIYVRSETPPWIPSATGGFGSPDNSRVWAMADFQYLLGTWQNNLYVGVQNSIQGGQVWAYDGSQPWWQANSSGFGDPSNVEVTALATFADTLWAGTSNNSGAEIHSFTGVTWSPKMAGGFGSAGNVLISDLVEHDGMLFAATVNTAGDGGEIWSTSNGTQWDPQLPPGFFADTSGISSLVGAGGALYAAVRAAAGVQVFRIDPPPIVQVNVSGFGRSANVESHAMVEYNGELYVGTTNAVSGGQVWRLRGTHWSQVNVSGFGDSNNLSISSLSVFSRRNQPGHVLFAGTQNGADGCQVWRYPVIFADDFETGDTIGWSNVVP